ncbi:DUF1552 domain-containing protein [Bremerella cremea]|uniref:DUF1552 domain-containing protein n=1 Tax=Blastopirellula marina TaxID=124 RepID=A0A2S8FVN4_9BACT|nr:MULTISPECIES: DUF1552 domain-containing protein [Pirellulaceae]PQO36238.1 hypothetical protein C5Y83_09995 [Blastopirellula marina]RCS48915.1 DUF1552 domain-containing protein [Bremerella cremea]
MRNQFSRREFLQKTGISLAAANLLMGLPSFGWSTETSPKKRLVFIFSPNGVIPDHFWPKNIGADFDFQRILKPLEPFRDQTMTIKGIGNLIKGDGDGHMRGMGCLLTGIELFPGDVQGGSDTPAGWAMGISVDQYLKNQLQANTDSQTRFGSLEFGVMVPDRADTWTRWSYAGPNQPVAPIDDPYQMFDKMYGQAKNREMLASVLDDLTDDFKKVEKLISVEDRQLLDSHVEMVRKVELELQTELAAKDQRAELDHAIPELPPNVREDNDNIPQITKMQIELMVNGFVADMNRVASLQITNSVGQPKMKWLGIDEGHHGLSHEPDSNEDAYEKLIKINTWYCEQVAYLAKRLAETPEPGANGSMLDHTTIVWTNELGKGNSHTHNDIPFVLVGNALGFKMGQALDYKKVPHNRLLMNICEAMGYPLKSFGNPDYCGDGALTGLT